jgi:uncharacterized membrane protein YvbJ
MFCKKCGGKITDGSDFCKKCGTRLETITSTKEGGVFVPQQRSKLFIKILLIIIGLVVGLIILSTVLFLIAPVL